MNSCRRRKRRRMTRRALGIWGATRRAVDSRHNAVVDTRGSWLRVHVLAARRQHRCSGRRRVMFGEERPTESGEWGASPGQGNAGTPSGDNRNGVVAAKSTIPGAIPFCVTEQCRVRFTRKAIGAVPQAKNEERQEGGAKVGIPAPSRSQKTGRRVRTCRVGNEA